MQIEQWFPVSVGIGQLSKGCLEEVKKTAFKWLEENQLKSHWSESVQTSYHDRDSFIKGSNLALLEEELLSISKEYLVKIQAPFDKLKLDFWINRFTPGSFEPSHAHYDAFLSGCLYITEEPNSGKFAIDDPIDARHQWLKINNIPPNNSNTFNTVSFDPQEGKVLVFQPWMKHYVTKHNGVKDRISVAFNVLKC